ncbi:MULTISPECIES: hypothetical protein [Microbacterium]|uniref:hypothetical protein n=1 Tax=Microbacterium TaxID=33882 RepID=UPI001E6116F4|nr:MULTISPECIES: hypothetical protein [Microbacterium]
MKTLDGKTMSAQRATQPVGSALRIAPGPIATAVDDTAGVETTLEPHYLAERGRYVITTIALQLDVPERTASDWIQKARAAGWLIGMTSNVGRPAGG